MVAAAVALSACAQAPSRPGVPASPGKPSVPRELRGELATPGLYMLPDGRALAVGVLHFRDIEGGFWAVFATRAAQQEDATAVAVIADPERLGDLQALDGQYVGVAGRLRDGVSSRMSGREMDAAWIALVSDLVDAEKTNSYGAGLHVLETGEVLAIGRLTRDAGGLVLVGETSSARLASVRDPRGRIPAAAIGQWVEMLGSAEETAGGPVFVAEQVGGYGAGPGTVKTGLPYRWRHVERPGLKELPGGRKRLVGILSTTYTGSDWYGVTFHGVVVYETMPLASGGLTRPYAEVIATGTLAATLRRSDGTYVALEGRLEPPAPRGPFPRFIAESVSVVTTMTPAPGESFH
jgi:hypothetical protein